MYKTIGAQFSGSSSTYYYLTDDMTIDVGDFCLVIGGNGDPAVVKVNDANAIDTAKKATKIVMHKVDTAAYFTKMKMLAEREVKMKRLEEISKEVVKKEKYKLLVGHSDEAKQLMMDLGFITEEAVTVAEEVK